MTAPTPSGHPLVLHTADGERLDAVHLTRPGPPGRCVVVAHSFAGGHRRAAARRVATALHGTAAVLAFDFRGHGRSTGRSTGGADEVLDLAAAVDFARAAGHPEVAAVGFSMGAACVLGYAAAHPGRLYAVVSVSGPARWQYRGSARMRLLQYALARPAGRLAVRLTTGTRVSPAPWDPATRSPLDLVARMSPTPLLLVHGDRDPYFPPATAEALRDAAGAPVTLWAEPGMGHGEPATGADLARRIGAWIAQAPTHRGDDTRRSARPAPTPSPPAPAP